ncbi:MAG: serine hydroxymethyltransferase [Hyphomonadaceae bacterium]
MTGQDDEVIFEITRIGDLQRVAAVHVATGVEVVLQAPASAAYADVRALALRKLERALQESPPPPPADRPGKLV